MKKIVFLLNELGYGGTENQVINLVNSLSDLYKIEIICNKISVNYKVNKKIMITELGVKEHFIGKIFESNIIKNVNPIINKADIVVVCDSLFNKIFDKLDIRDKETIYWVHDDIGKGMNKLNRYNTVVINNESVFKKYIFDNAVLIPYSINLYDVKKEYGSNKRIISVGKLNKSKCYDDLINVMELVVKEDKGIYLDIIGDGEERSNITNLIKDKGLENNINMLGSLSKFELIEELRDSSLYISTTCSDVFNLAMLEAMSVGLPVIAFENDGNSDLITNDIDGVLIKNRNLGLMKDSILLLLNNSEKCSDLGGCAVEKSMNFDINVIKLEWIKIFK